MKSDAGNSAFDNIDDLLADKIVDHSARHSTAGKPDVPENETPPSDFDGDFPFSVLKNLLIFAGTIALLLVGFLYLKNFMSSRKR